MKKIFVILLIIIMIIMTGSFYQIVKASTMTLEDGTKLEEGIELKTTRSKNLYERVRINGGQAITNIYDYKDTKENMKANTTFKIIAIEKLSDCTMMEVNFTGTSKANADTCREYWIKIADKDMEKGGKGSGLEKVNRTKEEEDANEAFKKKYAGKVDEMNEEELAEMEKDAEKLTSPDSEILALLQELDARRVEIGATTTGDTIYQNPNRADDGDSAEANLDDVVGDADSFVNQGETQYNDEALQNFSKTLYNILLAVGIAVAVIVGGIIGIKLMTSGIEEKAEAKKLLIPYLVGCIAVFGAFGIWKLIVNIVSGI